MQHQFDGNERGEPEKEAHTLTPVQLRPYWGKLPAPIEEPSSSSGMASSDGTTSSQGKGMAVAASPDLLSDDRREVDKPAQGGERSPKDSVGETVPVKRKD